MRTELRPPEVPVTPGDVTVIEIEVANTSDVIDGVTARVEGLDPSWVHLPLPVLSLFPESTGVLPVHVRFPPNTVVGDYLVVVHVESTIDPSRCSTHDLWLHVEAVEAATMLLRPSVVTTGKKATIAAVVTNAGNVATVFTMTAIDETRVLDCIAQPLTMAVPPGQELAAEITASGPRPWFGQPVARSIVVTAEAGEVQLRELATFNQRPRIPRGALTLAMLAGIVALWATIFLVGADLLRQQTAPTKSVAANFNTGGVQDVPLAAVAGSVSGQVTAEATGQGLERITVEAFRVKPGGQTEVTGSAGTADDGTYTLAALLPGTYKLRFTADGFDERWYPAAADEGAAGEVRVEPTGQLTDRDVPMVGRPGTLVGTVALPDSAAPGQPITVRVTQVLEQAEEATAQAKAAGEDPPPRPRPQEQETTGPISFDGLVTPATYRIRVAATGFEPQVFEETLAGGETRVLNTIRLAAGSGSISGVVRSSTGELLGNVEVTVTSGEMEMKAITPTAGNVGSFVVDGLETPRTYVLTFSREGFSSETIALDLRAGEDRTGVQATLTGGTGTVTGSVNAADGSPLGGVAVTVASGEFTATTATLTTSGAGASVGSYVVADIPTPGTYSVTFTLEGYVPETRLVTFLAPGVQGDVSVVLLDADATITGTVGSGNAPLVGVVVELSDARVIRTTTTASTPSGGYRFGDVPPGSYTLTFRSPDVRTRIVLVRVVAGEQLVRDVNLEPTS